MAAAASNFYTIIAGVGSGTGRSLALKFAATYPTIFLLSRSLATLDPIVKEINETGAKAIGIPTDVTSAQAVASAFASIKELTVGKNLAAAIYNVGGEFTRKPFLELSESEFVGPFEGGAHGLFHFAQQALPLLLDSVGKAPHPPTMVLTGATASIKGSAGCAGFAAGKFALRATGQSLAREFGPKGVHVAHAIIDGGIDTPWGKGMVFNAGKEDGKLDPRAIAEVYWALHVQGRSAWTQEVDLRPWCETF